MPLKLPTIRFVNIFKWLALIDMITILTLWIVAGWFLLYEFEIDQIVHFHFTHSIFDLIIISSFKAMILFIFIVELENASLCIILKTRESNEIVSSILNVELDSDSEVTTSTATIDDRNNLVAPLTTRNDAATNTHRQVKKLCHAFLLLTSLACLVYLMVKFSMVLYEVQHDRKKSMLAMSNLFFVTMCLELGFTLIQFLMACLSWMFMRRLAVLSKQQLMASVDSESQANVQKKVNFKRLIGLAHPERYLISVASVMLVISSVTNIAVPYFFGLVVDSAMKNPTLAEMNRYVIYMFLTFLVSSLAGGIRSWLFELAGQRVVARLRRIVFSAIVTQDIQFFDTNRTGDLTSRISSDSQVLQSAVTQNVSMMLRYFIQIVGCVAFMFTLQPALTGLLLGIIPVVVLMAVYYGRHLRVLRKKFQDDLGKASVVAEEAISSTRTVRSFAAESKVTSDFDVKIEHSFQIGKKLALALGGFIFFVGLLAAGAMALVLWYGGKLVHDQKLSTGILASFLMYTLQVAMALAFLSSLYGDIMQAMGASQRIFELLDTKPKIQLNVGIKPLTESDDELIFDGSLELCNVDFSYPTRAETRVLKEINLTIEKGQTIALVGPSGGGKSTVFALIERFYDPSAGFIRLNPSGTDLKAVNSNWLHSRIALVSQEPVLFGGSIKDNIAFGIDSTIPVSMDRIIEAAKQANAHEFIESFEKGYDTLVGERGIRLSGGQKQRIAIARALLVNPRLLLLDEATSALDSESEHLVQEAIDNAMKGRTVCIIAHRLSTVRNANKVVVIEQGTIVESGSHDELCEIDGIYKRLVLRQLMTKKDL